MKRNGYSLVEMLIVIAIIGILAGLATAGFVGWVKKYNTENQVKEMYADFMSTRIMAMSKNRTHFVNLSANQYTIYDDTSPSPNGDGTLTIGSDTQVLFPKDLKYPVAWNGGSQIGFNPRGLAVTQKTVCVYSTANPSYDCIVISQTRLIMGKLKTQGVCDSDNCKTR